MTFKRLGKYILDIEDSHLINVNSGAVFKFDFTDMVLTKINSASKPKFPIKYDQENQTMMVWKQKRWQPIEEGQKAIKIMFEAHIEGVLLDT